MAGQLPVAGDSRVICSSIGAIRTGKKQQEESISRSWKKTMVANATWQLSMVLSVVGSAGIFPYSVLIPASSRRFKLPRFQELGIGNGRTEDPIPSDRMIVS